MAKSDSPDVNGRESEERPATEDPSSATTRLKYIFSAEENSNGSKRKRKEADGVEEEDDEDDAASERKKNPGRRKIDIEYIQDKSKRHITFSKRKAGIMKKAYELATLTGTQLLLLVVSETGIVYTFTTPNLQPIVDDDPGKSLISSCLNAEDSEIQIEHEDPEDESAANQIGIPEEKDLMPLSSNQPATSGNSVHLPQPVPETYHDDNQTRVAPSSFSSNNPIPFFPEASEHLSQPYDPIFLTSPTIDNMYSNLSQHIELSSSDALGTIPNFQICPPGPSNLSLGENQSLFSLDGFVPLGPGESADRKVKRRRTETDLRQRAMVPDQRNITPAFPNQFPYEVQQNWLGNSDTMKLNNLSTNRPTLFDAPVLNTVVTSFLMRECGNFHAPIDVESLSTTRNFQNQLEKNITLFLDACDHHPPGESATGPRKWRQELFPRKQLLAECLKFFLEEYLPLLKPFPLESLASCCEDLQKLVQFMSIFYEEPEQTSGNLCEIVKNSVGVYMQNMHRSNQASTSAQGSSPSTATYTRLKSAPKLKPRKGVNITLKGGRLQVVLDKYADWCRKNKSAWSGNKPNSHVKGWFQVERVRRTFCCCTLIDKNPPERIAGVLKIRFPASAIKLIRKDDKIELEVKQSDDGSEWNIFQHSSFDLFPGDEQEEEESSVFLPSEGAVDTISSYKICEQKQLSPTDAHKWIENQRLMKAYIEAGDFEDDGFESKVPPKGGKQAFRVKKPSVSTSRSTNFHQFDLDDLVISKGSNSPHQI